MKIEMLELPLGGLGGHVMLNVPTLVSTRPLKTGEECLILDADREQLVQARGEELGTTDTSSAGPSASADTVALGRKGAGKSGKACGKRGHASVAAGSRKTQRKG